MIARRIIINKLDLLLSIGLVLLIFVWIGFAPVFYGWFCKDENSVWIKQLYEVLDNCLWINIPICLVILGVVIRWFCIIYNDKDIRLYRPILALLGIVILFSDKSQVTYAKIAGLDSLVCLDYRRYLMFMLVFVGGYGLVCLLLELVKKCCSKKGHQTEKKDCSPKGFSDDNISKVNVSNSLREYANVIVDRLLKTDITKQSFALGVTGEWGVGKTTFLRELKEHLKGYADIVEFNPWMCSSPEQVTNDFFASLRHQLSSIYSSLSNPIKEYSRYIGSLNVSSQSWASLKFLLPNKQESLFEKKRLLSDKFSKLPTPVVVIIDDIDRLERDEVFEVLRLIRNTADLSNMIYIVAYDKEYVTCVLEEKNIKDASAYLEKIFSIEVHLPKVEDHLIWKVLQDEINAQCSTDKKFHFDFVSDDKALILRILDNYRRAKRFARLYMLNIAYLEKNSKEELEKLDVFWLELLQMYDKKSYDVLANDANELLYFCVDRFRLRNGVFKSANEKDNYKFEGTPFWKEETPKILKKLFDGDVITNRQSNSICYIENYDKYFTMSVSDFKLSIREVKDDLLNANKDPNNIVKEWIKKGKYPSSIAYQLKHISVSQLENKQLTAYIQGILCFAMIIAPNGHNRLYSIVQILRKENYSDDLKKRIHDIVFDWFVAWLNKEDAKVLLYLNLGKLLKILYATKIYDEDEKIESFHEMVISNDEIEDLLVKLMKAFLKAEENKKITALDVLKEDGNMAEMFRSCCVNVYHEMTCGIGEYKQLAYDVVIDHFSSKENKPRIGDCEKALDTLFVPTFDNDYDYDGDYEEKMQMYFGCSYSKKMNNFKNKCFEKENIEGKKHDKRKKRNEKKVDCK